VSDQNGDGFVKNARKDFHFLGIANEAVCAKRGNECTQTRCDNVYVCVCVGVRGGKM
jgi:hypothetical protein